MQNREQMSKYWTRVVAAVSFAVVLGAGVAAVHGIVEVLLSGESPAQFLPVACFFYPIAGAVAGFGAGILIALLQALPLVRRLFRERPLPLLIGAAASTLYGAAALLEVVFQFLPHRVSLPTLAAAGFTVLIVTALTVLIGQILARRVATVITALLGIALAGSAGIAAMGHPGTVRSVVLQHPPAAPGSPNVVVVLIDTLRADHLSAYGYDRPTSPAIDELAASGIRFEHAYSQAPWTKPSVESLFTSRFVSELSGQDIYRGIPENVSTIAELLSNAGYQTAAFVANPVVNPKWGFNRGFDYFYYGFQDFARMQLHRYFLWLDLTQFPWYALRSDYLNGHARSWLEEIARSKEAPFFLYIHYMDPHEPYAAEERFQRIFAQLGEALITDLPYPLPKLLPFDALPRSAFGDADRRARIAAYDACIRQNDEALGNLLSTLRALGLWENTALILTADHGEEFFEHGGWGHGQSLFQELIHVPLIIRAPGDARAGLVDDRNVMLVDVLPTLASLAGTAPPPGIQGRDLLAPPATRSDEIKGMDGAVFAETFTAQGTLQAVIQGSWKQIRGQRGGDKRRMLFDLANDAAEQRSLIGGEGTSSPIVEGAPTRPVPEIATSLDAIWAARLGTLDQGKPVEQTELDDTMYKQLRALGYID